MNHWKNLYDSSYLGPHDFHPAKEVLISRMASEKMPARPGEVEKASGMLYLIGRDGAEVKRPLKLPRLVAYGIGQHFGTHDYKKWVGKKVTLFATMCMYMGSRVECVRIKFPPKVEADIAAYAKRYRINPSAYMLRDKAGNPEPYEATDAGDPTDIPTDVETKT